MTSEVHLSLTKTVGDSRGVQCGDFQQMLGLDLLTGGMFSATECSPVWREWKKLPQDSPENPPRTEQSSCLPFLQERVSFLPLDGTISEAQNVGCHSCVICITFGRGRETETETDTNPLLEVATRFGEGWSIHI